MQEWIERTIDALGLPGIALLMAAENLFPPLPSEVIMPLAGWTAGAGAPAFAGVVLAGTAGSLAGALALYALGARLGEARLHAWAARHGHWLLLTTADLDRSIGWFRRRGGRAVLLGRMVPGVRSLVSIPAGVARMPLGRFVALTALGTSAWAGLLAGLGRLLGKGYGIVERVLGPAALLVLAGLAVAYVVRALRLRSAAAKERERRLNP